MYAFYSKKQFDNFHNKDRKYIYYTVKNQQNEEKIVQVTEVTEKSKILFDDAVNLGTIIKHLGSFIDSKNIDDLNKL